jgi:predicted branched-subunit amino acid permease
VLPPLVVELNADQVMVLLFAEVADADGDAGAAGTVVTAIEPVVSVAGFEFAVPALFVPLTVNVYDVPPAKPVNVYDVEELPVFTVVVAGVVVII